MKLYHSPSSPFVRKVMVLLHEAGALSQVALVPAAGNPLEPGTMPVDRNPLGKIPALDRDDGGTIYDSRVITRYLDDVWQAGLYPTGPRLWEVLTLEATADGITDAAVLMRYETHVRPATARSADWVEAQWQKIARAVAAVEARWIVDLQSKPLDMGQIALGCALGYLDFRLGERDWRQAHPALADWERQFAQRPAMQATRPLG